MTKESLEKFLFEDAVKYIILKAVRDIMDLYDEDFDDEEFGDC